MRYSVLLSAYLLMMLHTFVPHHHHDVSDNLNHASADEESFHDHQHDHHHHGSENQNESTDHEESESPFSHVLSPVDGSLFIANQTGISIEKNPLTDILAILVTPRLSLSFLSPLTTPVLFPTEQIYSSQRSGACGLRAPPIC